ASLRPPTLDEVGLEAALRDHVGAFARRSGVSCSVKVDLDGRLDGELETVVYRVTQEGLLNVARPAGAGRLWVGLEGAGDRVDLSIRDDGVGFQPPSTTALVRDGRFGLVAMRERVEMAGGRFQLDAHPGGGGPAVDGIDLDIREGELLTLLGPSGSGKTSTLRMVAGFELPTEGTVHLGGVDVTTRPPYERDVNPVFQDYPLFPHMSVAENVGYGLRVRKVPRAERRQRVAAALAQVRL